MVREQDLRFRNLERKIGIFIAAALAGILIAVLLYGAQKDFFTKKFSLYFIADRGTGFSKGMPVKLSGFRIGRVTSVSLNNLAMVDVFVEIDSQYRTWIRSDSRVRLIKEGLVGDTIVDISVGSPEKPQVKDKDSLDFIETKSLDQMADELVQKVKPVLTEMRDIIHYINDPESDLKKTIRNAEQLTRRLEETRQNSDRLLVTAAGNVDRVATRANILLDSTRTKIEGIDVNPTLTRINSTLDQVNGRLPALLEKTDSSLENVRRISLETRLLSEKAFPKIPGVISQAEDVMLSTDRLINSLQNTWLLRAPAVSADRQDLIPGDSHE